MAGTTFKKTVKENESPKVSYKQIIKLMREKPLICTSIIADNKKDFIELVKNAADGGADLAELRIDFLKDKAPQNITEIIFKSGLPLIITNRNKESRGTFPSGNESLRLALLYYSINAKPAFIDIEYVIEAKSRTEIIDAAHKNGVGVICSHHDFQSTPTSEKIIEKYEEVCETGADVAKLVYTPHSREEVVNILQAVETVVKLDKIPSTIFGMGDVGQNTRILSPVIGSCMTYCALNADSKSGLSQLSLKDTKELFDLLATKKGWKALRKEHKDVLSAAMEEYLSTYSYPYGMGQIIEQ